jgi:hypothetical protein
MGSCKNHPDSATTYLCQKHNYSVCEQCLNCSDPNLYCKFRPSCIIFFKAKKPKSFSDTIKPTLTEKETAHE